MVYQNTQHDFQTKEKKKVLLQNKMNFRACICLKTKKNISKV